MSMFSPVRPANAPSAASALSGCAISHLLRARSRTSSGEAAANAGRGPLVPRGSTTATDWRNHYYKVPNSNQTWLMAFGKGIPAKGELTAGEYHNNQVAATIAALLGIDFTPSHEGAGKKIEF